MPYTPSAVDTTQPADVGIDASTAAAEFRALKTFILTFLSQTAGVVTQVKAPAGSAGTPGVTFAGDLTTGFYRVSANVIGVTVGGVNIGNFDSTTGWTGGISGGGGPAAAGTLTGTTLAANVVNSSLTSVGTLVNLTVTNPISGAITGNAGSATVLQTARTIGGTSFNGSANIAVGLAATATALATARTINGTSFDGTANITVTAAGSTLTGTSLAAAIVTSSLTSLGTIASFVCTAGTVGGFNIGYKEIPQNSQSAAYTLVLADAAKHIFHPSADTTARIWTIPANSSVAFPVGTAVTFINQNAGGVITIAITTDTLRLAGPGTTGSRTLAANGIATAVKVTTTEWIISGTGLT